jgi:hypothetical protein
MEALFCPQVGCVMLVDAVMPVDGLNVTEAVAVQPVAVCVTVTEYVPDATLVGLAPESPPVHE